ARWGHCETGGLTGYRWGGIVAEWGSGGPNRSLNYLHPEDIKKLDRASIDRRYAVTMALEAMARDRKNLAGKWAAAAKLRGRITKWQAEILGEPLDRLRQLPEWQDALPAK
ncbi:MAG: hypothetical protein ACI85K_003116, partial [Hyphomicrobiaceae bacterium]